MMIGIIGCGHVGLVSAACFAEKGNTVFCVDNDENRIKMLKLGKMPFYEPEMEAMVLRNCAKKRIIFSNSIKEAVEKCPVLFISVSTPSASTGALDLSAVEHVCRNIAINMRSYRLIIEKSTVPVKTSERVEQTLRRYIPKGVTFDIASNPEFLREGSAIWDSMNPDRIVIGVSSKKAETTLRKLYKPFKAPVIVTDVKSAELIKHASNAFLAMKISFINSVANICELSGANVDEVAYGMGLDQRIGSSFLKAGAGYGGSCFPKDVLGFISIADSLGYDFGILKEVQKTNIQQRMRILKKIETELWVLAGKKVAVLGLAFKPDTDDMREAPAVEIIKGLVEKGAIVSVYDPKAMEASKKVMPQSIRYCANAYDTVKGADCVVILTEWKEFADLDLKKVKELVQHPTIVDGRNMFDPEKMKKLGFVYRSVGRH